MAEQTVLDLEQQTPERSPAVSFSTIQVSVFGPFPERDQPWVTTVTRQTGGFPTGCTIPSATRADAWDVALAAVAEIHAQELDR